MTLHFQLCCQYLFCYQVLSSYIFQYYPHIQFYQPNQEASHCFLHLEMTVNVSELLWRTWATHCCGGFSVTSVISSAVSDFLVFKSNNKVSKFLFHFWSWSLWGCGSPGSWACIGTWSPLLTLTAGPPLDRRSEVRWAKVFFKRSQFNLKKLVVTFRAA